MDRISFKTLLLKVRLFTRCYQGILFSKHNTIIKFIHGTSIISRNISKISNYMIRECDSILVKHKLILKRSKNIDIEERVSHISQKISSLLTKLKIYQN